VNGICSCGLSACCCQLAVAGGVIYADLRGELSTHLAPLALFTQSLPMHELLLQAFPFPSTLGEVTLHPLSQACMFVYSSNGKWVFPRLLWSFPPTTTFTSFPASGCWACAAAPALSGQAQLVHLQFCEGFTSPTSALRAPHPLCYMSLLFLLLITQFLSFSWVAGRSVQGAMLIWPRVVCGSTAYCLAHLVVHVFPGRLGAGVWQRPGGPPGFSIQCEVEMLCVGWRCGGVKVLPLLSGLACKVCLQCLSRISL
jgi:hypothetical protein